MHYLKLLALPLTLLVVSISLRLIWIIFDLPPFEVMLPRIEEWFSIYGLPILFVSAICEGMLLVGAYFPGLFVILVSVLLATSPCEAVLAVVVGTSGLIIAHAINYILGKYGWYRLLIKFGLKNPIEESRKKLVSKGPWVIWGSYWLPSMSALTDTAAGIIHMPFRKFILNSIAASFFWNSLAGIIIYTVGDPILYLVGGGNGNNDLVVPLVVVGIWSGVILMIEYRKRRGIQA